MIRNFLSLIISTLLFFNTAYSAETRTVEESNKDVAWKVDGKFIKAECFDYIWNSGDRYETFYDEYFEKPSGSHWDDPKFVKFTENVGMYLNKEVPLNHSIDPDWDGYPKISLTKQLEGCLSEKPETFIRFTDGTSNTIGYKVVHNFDRYIAKELAPYIDQTFESVKQVEIEEWGGGSMPPQTHMVVFGVLELEGKKVLLPLRNKSILTEIAKRDTFFRGNGRFSYEAEFDLNDNITKIININDFKQMVSSDGCFKINDFATDGKIYDFLKKNKLKNYCNEVRPFDDISWLLKQREFKTNQDLINRDKEHRFSNLIRSQVPDIQVPWNDYPSRLAEELIDSITFEDDIQYLENGKQVVVSGCVYKFCTQKGLIFAYKDNFIGLIRHGTEEWDVDDFFIFSKKHKNFIDLPDSFFVAVKTWIAEKEIDITETKEKKSLGVRIEEVTKEIAEVKELKNTNGASIVSVDKTSPAGKAGLKAGDIILKFDGKKIEDYQSLVKVISGTKIDKTVRLEIWRNKKLVTKNLTLVSTKIPGSRVRFIGSDNKINEVENLFVSSKSTTKCVAGDCINGTGVYMYKDGSKYSGEFKNGKRHGFGNLKLSGGTEFIGQSKQDVFYGNGTIMYPSGDKYVGEIKNNKRNGKGTYTFKNGLTSSGEWKDNKAVGKHTTSDTEGVAEKAIEKIIDEKASNNESKIITETYENGDKYVGTLKDGKKHGKGIYTLANGMQYTGDFKDNEWHGKGTLVYPKGEKYVGDFKMGVISGKGYLSRPSGNYHEGEYLNNQKHGHGFEKSANGNQYVGNYKEGRFHGYGVLTTADGKMYKGTWEMGELVK